MYEDQRTYENSSICDTEFIEQRFAATRRIKEIGAVGFLGIGAHRHRCGPAVCARWWIQGNHSSTQLVLFVVTLSKGMRSTFRMTTLQGLANRKRFFKLYHLRVRASPSDDRVDEPESLMSLRESTKKSRTYKAHAEDACNNRIATLRVTISKLKQSENQGLLTESGYAELQEAKKSIKNETMILEKLKSSKKIQEKEKRSYSSFGSYKSWSKIDNTFTRESRSLEGKRHVKTAPVRLIRAQEDYHKSHPDTAFSVASIRKLECLASLLGDDSAFISQDDKARVPISLTAANKQAPFIMHMDYLVHIPDHTR
ncbi:hypothetical protein EVAR_10348_1 [Eumeta japonica]|uniref:Uncharacterized protein n=1 Tax=Eumeta variegata TaxID=151549 RepID=A0A4C1TDY5_EUMVA|nr:hypothetical protein EVAR_10348_1 [Eumeta japonica]